MDRLIELITKEVLKRMEGTSKLEENNKEKILLLEECDSLVTGFKKVLEDKYAVDIYRKESQLENYKTLIIPRLCLKGLTNAALGLCNGKAEAIIIEALFKGIKVYVLEEGMEYRRYAATANENLFKLFKQYEERIISNGVTVISSNGLINTLINDTKSRSVQVKEETVKSLESSVKQEEVINLSSKKLISESDLRKIFMSGVKEVNLAKKSILTPLAQDFIRIHHLKVNRI